MFPSIFKFIKIVKFGVIHGFIRNPLLKQAFMARKFMREENLAPISKQYGIRLETLQKQKDTGLDNPAYRFHRESGFYSYFATHAESLKGYSWLDVGAGQGVVSLYLSEMLDSTNFELCDITVAPRLNFPVKQIAGTHLDYEEDSFDLVLFSYVLHHSADDTIQLLLDAHRIARKYVVVLEDPKETNDDYFWACMHDKQGTFRGRKEWKQLFSALSFSVVYEEALNCEIHSRHFYLLAPNKIL